MLDPITAIALAGNIVQFVDLSSKIVLTALKIYKSPSGSTEDGFDANLVADHIFTLKSKIESNLAHPSTSEDEQLLALGKRCADTADEIVTLFRSKLVRLKSPGFLIATKEALRLAWKKEDIEKLQVKLASFRQELALHILVDLRETIAAANILQSEQYASMDTWTKGFVDAIAEQRNVFVETLNAQSDELKEIHIVTRTAMVDEHGQTRSVFVAELKTNAKANVAEHNKTRVELRDSFILEATMLRKEIDSLRLDILDVINEAMRYPERFARYSDTSSRAWFRGYDMSQRSKHLNAAVYAKDNKLSELMTKITTDEVQEMIALLEGETPSTPAAEPKNVAENAQKAVTSNSTRSFVLGSNILPFGTPFKIDEKLLREGCAQLGFNHGDLTGLPASLGVAISNRFSIQQINGWHEDMKLALNSIEPFFFAGSFMFPSVLRLRTNGTSLQGIASSMTPARLRGYHTFVVRDAVWPALYPCGCSTDSTPGMLVFGLRDSQRRSLLDFQGGMFDLRFEVVQVQPADGGAPLRLKAASFVWNGPPSDLVPLHDAKWSPTSFMTTSFYRDIASVVSQEEKVLAQHFLPSIPASSIEDQNHRDIARNGNHQPSRLSFASLQKKKKKIFAKERSLKGRGTEEAGVHSIYMTSIGQHERTGCGDFLERYSFPHHRQENRLSSFTPFELDEDNSDLIMPRGWDPSWETTDPDVARLELRDDDADTRKATDLKEADSV